MNKPRGGLGETQKSGQVLPRCSEAGAAIRVARLVFELHIYTDSDWAGDRETSKSTYGGAVTWGRHTLKTWATTQAMIALSSGEDELYAYGILFMLGLEMGCTVCTDASAAIGIVHRQGLGKTRRIEVQHL